MISKLGQNKSKMLSMFFFGFGIDKDVIDVNDDELIEVLVEMEFISLMNVAGAFVRPKDMTVYSYKP